METPPLNESDLFRLDIPEGCVMNKLIQPDNLTFTAAGVYVARAVVTSAGTSAAASTTRASGLALPRAAETRSARERAAARPSVARA